MDEERKTRKLPGCLVRADEKFPQDKVLLCGFCSNRSDIQGDLMKNCGFGKAPL